MIICPSCKEEIEDASHFCDQCGQELAYCSSCGRVGMGRRCTFCGGLMVTAEELVEQRKGQRNVAESASIATFGTNVSKRMNDMSAPVSPGGLPTLIFAWLESTELSLAVVKVPIPNCLRVICISQVFMPSLFISPTQDGISSTSILPTAPS